MASQVKLFKPSVYHLKHLKFSIRHYIDLCHYSSRLKKVLYMCFVRENGLIRLTFVVDIMGKISETFALDTYGCETKSPVAPTYYLYYRLSSLGKYSLESLDERNE